MYLCNENNALVGVNTAHSNPQAQQEREKHLGKGQAVSDPLWQSRAANSNTELERHFKHRLPLLSHGKSLLTAQAGRAGRREKVPLV